MSNANRSGEQRVRTQASIVLTLVDAVRAAREGGWDREEFVKFASEVFEGVTQQDERARTARGH
jgi:hypothetical protein